MKPKPIFNHVPNLYGVMTAEEDMASLFLLMSTKGTNQPIRPTSFVKAGLDRPNPTVDDDQANIFLLRRGPFFPN
jgi:hypothetical protein